ncbi:outer membrane protein assembly factor BamB family protein [Lignipirellula cremea]|uniref:Outer membrane biogenesis protein BamB n=1 Tax=Lignipirellula cremea TaxID=2528010 RepID=A0A518DZI8_9BACT|nr:PQQ-binding-like beta-propeller repeat protein [Lignipirellula cremea]QDU97256.1 outer membrane biogenesis protein BamB [Lignipirellula cremea]
MLSFPRWSFLVGGCLALFPVFTAQAVDSPQFLGAQRNGISAEKGVLPAWPADGPEVLWRSPVGEGMSAVAVAGDKVVTLRQIGGNQEVVALDAQTGDIRWRTPVGNAYENSQGDGPRATPTIAGERIFVFTGDGVLGAFQLSDGAKIWQKNVVMENRGQTADYGMACSPLVAGDLVIVQAGAPNATLVACDAATGEQKWKAGDGPAGYSSPVLLNVGGRQQIVALAGSQALGVSLEGKLLWEYDFETAYECNTASPIAIDGMVFLSAGENHGSVLLELRPRDDVFQPTEKWESLRGGSVLRSEWQTPVLIDGYLYGFDNVGSAGPVTHLTCLEAATGKRMWQETRFGKGNLIAVDGKLLMTTFTGELVLAKIDPQEYKELGRTRLTGPTRQAPVVANGRIYLRDNREVVCLSAK